MPDQQVPVSTQLTNSAVQNIMTLYNTNLTANSQCQIVLYQNAITWSRNTLYANLVVANFGGYVPITVSAWTAPNLDQNGTSYMYSQLALFQCNGTSGNTINGVALLAANAGTRATGTAVLTSSAVTSVSISQAGTLYEVAPPVTFTGGGGTGAAGVTTIVNGSVGGVSLTSGGTGYTAAPTVAFGYPQSLVGGGQFAAPVNVALATDAIPVAFEIPLGPENH
jgi:hypothetical protein